MFGKDGAFILLLLLGAACSGVCGFLSFSLLVQRARVACLLWTVWRVVRVRGEGGRYSTRGCAFWCAARVGVYRKSS